jgi:homoserine acetyltransferase
MVDAILPICGAASVSNHNPLFLEGAKKALLADPASNERDYKSRPEAGMEAFATVHGGWVFRKTSSEKNYSKTSVWKRPKTLSTV